MDFQRRGYNLSPLAISQEARFGFGPWSESTVEEDQIVETGEAKKKGQWWKDNGAEIIKSLPEWYCAVFPQQCARPPTTSTGPAPVVVQQGPKRDWLMIGLLVLIMFLMGLQIFKK